MECKGPIRPYIAIEITKKDLNLKKLEQILEIFKCKMLESEICSHYVTSLIFKIF